MQDISTPVNTVISEEKGETVTTIKPQVVEEPTQQQPAKKTKKKVNKKKDNSVAPNDVLNKEVNDKSPIVY